MVQNCTEYAEAARNRGLHVVGICCEYTPRELILAAGGVPVCLCGGSQATIPPAEDDLPANLCPLIKSTYGYHLTKENPLLEMAELIVAETTCDGKKKMYELLAESRALHVLELPQKPGDPDAAAHWRAEVGKLARTLEERFETEITRERLREAVRLMNRDRSLHRRLARLMRRDRPPLTGRHLLCFQTLVAGIPEDHAAMEAFLAEHEGREPEETGGGAPVRVLLTGVPLPHGAERVLDLIEEGGGLVVCMENCTGLKPILEDVDDEAPDLLQAVADKYFHLPCSVMTRNETRLSLLEELAREYRAECIIELVWQACLTYDVESVHVRRLAERMGLPYLMIQTDYSPADSARIAVRVEALFETVESRRPAAVER